MTHRHTRKDYLADRCTHRAYYAQFVTDIVRSGVARYIGIDTLHSSTDEHLNDIPLRRWDALPIPPSVPTALHEAGDCLTMAGWVCIAKTAAQQILETQRNAVATVETLHASPEIPLWRWVIDYHAAPAAVADAVGGTGAPFHTAESFGAALARAAQGGRTLETVGTYHVTDTRRAGRAHTHSAGAFRVMRVPVPGSGADPVTLESADSLIDAERIARADIGITR